MIQERTHLAMSARRGLPLRASIAPTSAGAARSSRARTGGRATEVGGFTLIELLVVIAIIIILLSLLIVAVNQASRAGQKANTQTLMNSIAKGLVTFREEIGYYPPVLGEALVTGTNVVPANDLRNLYNPPLPPGPTSPGTPWLGSQQWYSVTTIADYLVGWDNHWLDGYGMVQGDYGADLLHDWEKETPASGIRHPGDPADGIWGAGDNGLLFRMGGDGGGNPNGSWNRGETNALPIDQGKIYGPYLELRDDVIMGSTDGTWDANGNLKVYFPGQVGYSETGPMVICDYWGTPLRYYRRPYPQGALNQSHRANTDINRDGVINAADVVPTLSDVFLLRPWEIKPGAESTNRFADSGGSTTTTRDLDAAEFAIWSAGPDRNYDATRANDDEGTDTDGDDDTKMAENKDNITEVGP